MARILLVEDEDSIGEVIELNLTLAGHSVVRVSSAEAAQDIWEGGDTAFDIALLDVMMPGMDGFTLCKKIREKSDSIGIIMLSAKSQEMDKVNGLMLGADDYVTKPFSPSELVARVDAVHRRVTMAAGKGVPSGDLVSGEFVLNQRSRTLTKGGQPIDLTQVEFQIMEVFMKNPDTALARADILNQVWGDNYFGDDKIVDVNIRRLRMKIEDDPSEPKHLCTVWGYGYKWSK